MLTFRRPPLPFLGNKSKWAKALFEMLKKEKFNVIIDAFGGSGLLSRTAKDANPNAAVYYNDFDDYAKRIGKISQTNKILKKISQMLVGHQGRHIPDQTKAKILDIIPNDADFLTISSRLLYSGDYAKTKEELSKCTFYNGFGKTFKPYNANGYLDGLSVTSKDALELIKELKQKHKGERILLLLDPPYLQTYTKGHKYGFSIAQNLELIKLLTPPFCLFSSTRSEIKELLDYSGITYQIQARKFFMSNARGNNTDLLFYSFGNVA